MSKLEGIIRDLPDADYRAAPGYGSTALKWFLEEVPAQAKHWIDHPEDAPTFEGSELGTFTHALVLDQPHGFIVKDWSYSTKAGKSRAAEILAEHGGPKDADLDAAGFAAAFTEVGVSLIGEADYKLAKGMAEGVLRHPTIRAFLEQPGSGECSVFAEVEGVRCKARFDYLPDPSGKRMTAIDLKTAFSAHPAKFTKNAARFEYGVQYAGYLDVLNAVIGPMPLGMEPTLLFAVVDKRPPHFTSLIGLPELWSQKAQERVTKARRIIRECEERERSGDPNAWPDYGPGIHYIDPPTWYLIADEDQEIEI